MSPKAGSITAPERFVGDIGKRTPILASRLARRALKSDDTHSDLGGNSMASARKSGISGSENSIIRPNSVPLAISSAPVNSLLQESSSFVVQPSSRPKLHHEVASQDSAGGPTSPEDIAQDGIPAMDIAEELRLGNDMTKATAQDVHKLEGCDLVSVGSAPATQRSRRAVTPPPTFRSSEDISSLLWPFRASESTKQQNYAGSEASLRGFQVDEKRDDEPLVLWPWTFTPEAGALKSSAESDAPLTARNSIASTQRTFASSNNGSESSWSGSASSFQTMPSGSKATGPLRSMQLAESGSIGTQETEEKTSGRPSVPAEIENEIDRRFSEHLERSTYQNNTARIITIASQLSKGTHANTNSC